MAVLRRIEPTAVRTSVGPDEFDGSGRWAEADLPTRAGTVTVASAYVHTGEAGTERQDEKLRFLDAVSARMKEGTALDALAVVPGDLNVCHREEDLRSWRGNLRVGTAPACRR